MRPITSLPSNINYSISPSSETGVRLIWPWFTKHASSFTNFLRSVLIRTCFSVFDPLEQDKSLTSHRLVLYSSDDPRNKANIALLMALYVVRLPLRFLMATGTLPQMIVQRRAPWEAFQPIAELEFMPFRDAGRGPPDFNLSIQDCLWGVWKAMQNGLCDMNEFSVEDYELYEKVENGDWNWITPNFIAFASPVDMNWWRKGGAQQDNKPVDSSPTPAHTGANGVQKSNSALQRKLPTPFLNCLKYFQQKNIKLVIRLNTALYDKSLFLERGIEHLELYFDDGTNPTDEIVRTFIDVSDRVVEGGGVVAVHVGHIPVQPTCT
jgi:cell division cycle 14